MTVNSLHLVSRNCKKLGQLPIEISNIYICLMSSLFNSTKKKHKFARGKFHENHRDVPRSRLISNMAVGSTRSPPSPVNQQNNTGGSMLEMGNTWMVVYGQPFLAVSSFQVILPRKTYINHPRLGWNGSIKSFKPTTCDEYIWIHEQTKYK